MLETRIDLEPVKQFGDAIRAELAKVIVGQQELSDLYVAALLSDGHVLLEGVPGVAKTLSAKALARTMGLGFSRIQFTPDLMPSDIIGTMIFNPKTTEFQFKNGPVFSNIVLVDEINRSPAKTQAALLEVMEERQITVDGQRRQLESPFFVIATQNPVEHEGTYRLPEAQLDRFLFKIEVGYPNLEEETRIITSHHQQQLSDALSSVQAVAFAEDMQRVREIVRTVHVEQKIVEYIARLVQATRTNASLYLGASPRASIGIVQSAKAIAALNGLDFVSPDHIRVVIAPVLRHRIQLTPEREMEGAKTDDVIREIIENTDVPR